MDIPDDMKRRGPGSESALSVSECQAMRILHFDGWTVGELSMTFQVANSTCRKHLTKRCAHTDLAAD